MGWCMSKRAIYISEIQYYKWVLSFDRLDKTILRQLGRNHILCHHFGGRGNFKNFISFGSFNGKVVSYIRIKQGIEDGAEHRKES